MTKRIIAFVLTVSLCFSLLIGCGNSADPKASNTKEAGNADVPETVNIGVQTLVTPELIARYEGIYEKYLGCKVNLLQFDSGADVNRAFASGSIDIGAIGTSPATIGISTDLGYEVFWFYDVIGAAESLVVQADSGITSVKDLVGKKVATPFASTAHFSLQNALSLEGVDISQVELFDMQPDDIYAAWTRGDIDAAYVWNPVLSKLYENGGVAITNSEELAKKGVVTADLAVINKEFAEKYPDIATGYIKAQLYAVDMVNNEHSKAVEEIAKAIDIPSEDAETQMKGFVYPDGKEQLSDAYFGSDGKSGNIAKILKQSADFLAEQGSIDSAPDTSVFAENSTGEFIQRAMSE